MIISTPICNICGNQMKVRMKGLPDNKGELFWGCSNYPTCKNTMPFNSLIDDKKLHKAIHDAVWGSRSSYHGDAYLFTSENYETVSSQFPGVSPEEFLSWGIDQLRKYKPGDLHNHDLNVGSPHTESLAGFVAFLKLRSSDLSQPHLQIPEHWNEIITKIKIVK